MSERTQSSPNGTSARALSLFAVLAVLLATLWPFNPFPQNGVHWEYRTKGLKFEKAGLVISDGPLEPPETPTAESYSLEILLSPATVASTHTILAFYAPTHPRQFIVRQWTNGLVVTHDETVDRDKTKTVKFDVGHVFHRGRLTLVTLSSGPNGTKVYLDGQPTESIPTFKISRTELSGEIVLGTSPTTYQPWRGELRGLAIYSRELSPASALQHYEEWTTPKGNPDLDGALARYTFAEAAGPEVHSAVSAPNLEIPATFSVPHKSLLRLPAKEFKGNWEYVFDLLVNIAGFVPLGLILCAAFLWTSSRQQAILITIISCATLSLVIEVLQYYIPRRGSGTTDIITNTLGAVLGTLLAQSALVRHILAKIELIPIFDMSIQQGG